MRDGDYYMSKIIYRDINKKDYEDIKKLICEAFGFDKFIKMKIY